jgi:Tol biopolymer transport system component
MELIAGGESHPGPDPRVKVVRRGRLAIAVTLALAAAGCGDGASDPTTADTPGGSPAQSSSPASAGGTAPWLAYQAPGSAGDGIFLVRADGEDAHQILTDVPGEQVHPDWSPSGTELAFIASEETGEVWVSDADGSHARRVAACTGACLAYDFVAWMPSGHGLLMMRYDGPETDAGVPSSSSLELLDLDAGTKHDVARSAAHELFSAPRVSPDGTSYCVTAETGDVGQGPTATRIEVGKIGGGPARTVSEPSEWGSYCDWRPTDAGQVVYSDHDLGIFGDMGVPSNLYLVRADGSGRTQLTHFATGELRATQPRWTPDGTRILFTAVDGDGSLASRRMASADPDSAEVQPATGEHSLVGTHPALQPMP